jgi:hypothetical protein
MMFHPPRHIPSFRFPRLLLLAAPFAPDLPGFFADAASPRREAVAVVSSNVATGFGASSFSASRAPLRRALRRGALIPEFVFTTCSGVRVVMAVMGAAVSEEAQLELNGGSAAVFISNH